MNKYIFLLISSIFIFIVTLIMPFKCNAKINQDINPRVFEISVKVYKKLLRKNNINHRYLTIIDYSLPSNKKRLWVIDMFTNKTVFNTYVAHGKNSGTLMPKKFSNIPNSKETSLGVYITENTYHGHRGYSLRVKGLEKGINSNAEERNIVVHGAPYMSPSFIHSTGRAGLSWGCFAVSNMVVRPLINTIKGGTAIFVYAPNTYYRHHSRFFGDR